MESTGHIFQLPMEILLNIIELLDGNDVIAFSRTCHQFSVACGALRSLNFANDFYVKPEDLKGFFRNSIQAKLITTCDFTNCYFVPIKILHTIIEKCTNVSVLKVAHTELTCNLLKKIFCKCTNIVNVSMSINVKDFWTKGALEAKSLDKILPAVPEGCPWERLFHLTAFRSSEQFWKKLKVLELHLPPDSVMLGIILSACESLEKLCLNIQGDSTEMYNRLVLRKLERVFVYPLKAEMNLQTFVFNLSSENCFTRCEMIVFVQCHITKPRPNHHYRQFWADRLSCPPLCPQLTALACNDERNAEFNLIPTLQSLTDRHYLSGNFYATEAKLIQCVYSSVKCKAVAERFEEFCWSHHNLTCLKLDIEDENSRLPSSQWSLPHLQSLSIAPSLVASPGLLQRALTSTQSLEELEICFFTTHSNQVKLLSAELSLICRFGSLKNLTLGGFLIDDGKFIEKILKNCRQLRSLRLNDIGPSALCCYTKYLCVALPDARHLTHFRLKQSNVTPLGQLLRALEKCTSLTQLGLIVPSKSAPHLVGYADIQKDGAFNKCLTQLMNQFPQLVAFYMALSLPASACAAASKHLNSKFVPKRPAFRAEVVSLRESVPLLSVGRVALHGQVPFHYTLERPSLPHVHCEALFDCSSRVAVLPYCFDI